MIKRLYLILLLLTGYLTVNAQVGELPRSTPGEQGVSSELLNSFYRQLTGMPDVDVHHLMVLRHGKVIGELHAPGGKEIRELRQRQGIIAAGFSDSGGRKHVVQRSKLAEGDALGILV